MPLRFIPRRDDDGRRTPSDAAAHGAASPSRATADDRGFRPGAALLPLQQEALRRFDGVAGLIFDMGDVLFDATTWRRWLLQLLRRVGLHASYRSFFQIWDRDYLDAVHRGERDYDEAFQSFLRDSGLSRNQIDEVRLASQIRKREIEADVRPLPGVRSTLERLRAAGVRLAVLTDSESTGPAVAARLAQLGIGDAFLAVVSSFDLKATKPAEICYRRAAESLNLEPRQTAFVGHDREELIGARRAGMLALAVNFDRDAAADLFLGRFDELLSLFMRPPTAARRFGEAA